MRQGIGLSSGKAGSRQGSDNVSTSFLVSPALGLTSFSHSQSHMKLSAVPGSLFFLFYPVILTEKK